MATVDIAQMAHVAELVGLRVYAAALLASARDSHPEVVSLRLTVQEDTGLTVIEGEYFDRQNNALGGFGL